MCEYCEVKEGKSKSYQTSRYTNLYFERYGKKVVLTARWHGCPQFADCSAKDVNIGTTFFVNYCPNCGARLVENDSTDGNA